LLCVCLQVVRTVTRKKAHRITMEAHKSGLATVTTTWKQLAREYSVKLRKTMLATLPSAPISTHHRLSQLLTSNNRTLSHLSFITLDAAPSFLLGIALWSAPGAGKGMMFTLMRMHDIMRRAFAVTFGVAVPNVLCPPRVRRPLQFASC